MEKRSTVIIIDSGLSYDYAIKRHVNIIDEKNFCEGSDSNINDNIGHGTSVANIIHSFNNKINFVIIKIYDTVLEQDIDILIKALQYLIDKNYTNSIVHMSIGIEYYIKELDELCYQIYRKNNLIVSAFDNAGCISYPAGLDCVIGVDASDLCVKKADFIVPENEVVKVYAKGGIHRTVSIDGKNEIHQGSSYAAAYVTGFLSQCEGLDYQIANALSLLKKESLKRISGENIYGNQYSESYQLTSAELSKIQNVSIFPYNKETQVLVKFCDKLSFKIDSVYTSKYLGNINAEILSNTNENKFYIKNIDNIDYKKIDTLIIGHLSRLEIFVPGIKERLLQKCLQEKVNVFSFDSYLFNKYFDLFVQNDVLLRCPSHEIYKKKKRGKLYQFATPVLAVFGTSSVQGKFTLQLSMKYEMESKGYRIGFLSTEPEGPLLGADQTFAYGYDGERIQNTYNFVDMVNTLLHKIDCKNYDMIITGAQSATLGHSYNNIGDMALKQIEFLMGVHPDAVLLCVNYNDDLEYIRRTINVIESLADTEVIGVVPFKFGFRNDWKRKKGKMNEIPLDNLNEIGKKILSITGKKVYIKDDIIQNICEDVIIFFSEERENNV